MSDSFLDHIPSAEREKIRQRLSSPEEYERLRESEACFAATDHDLSSSERSLMISHLHRYEETAEERQNQNDTHKPDCILA